MHFISSLNKLPGYRKFMLESLGIKTWLHNILFKDTINIYAITFSSPKLKQASFGSVRPQALNSSRETQRCITDTVTSIRIKEAIRKGWLYWEPSYVTGNQGLPLERHNHLFGSSQVFKASIFLLSLQLLKNYQQNGNYEGKLLTNSVPLICDNYKIAKDSRKKTTICFQQPELFQNLQQGDSALKF